MATTFGRAYTCHPSRFASGPVTRFSCVPIMHSLLQRMGSGSVFLFPPSLIPLAQTSLFFFFVLFFFCFFFLIFFFLFFSTCPPLPYFPFHCGGTVSRLPLHTVGPNTKTAQPPPVFCFPGSYWFYSPPTEGHSDFSPFHPSPAILYIL